MGSWISPIQDAGDKKAPPTSFSPVTSTNVAVTPQHFLIFSFNPFAISELHENVRVTKLWSDDHI